MQPDFCFLCGSFPETIQPSPDVLRCSDSSCPFFLLPMTTVVWNAIHSQARLKIKRNRKPRSNHCTDCDGHNPHCDSCHGLNLAKSQAAVLHVLKQHDTMKVAAISQAISRPSSWVSHKLGKLVSMGYVIRESHGIYRAKPYV